MWELVFHVSVWVYYMAIHVFSLFIINLCVCVCIECV